MAETLLGRLLEAALKAVAHALLRERTGASQSVPRASPVEHEVGAYTRTHKSGKVVEVRGYKRGE